MKNLSKCVRGIIVIIFIFGLAASAWAEEKAFKMLAPWEAQGRVFRVGPDTLQFLGTFEGIMYIESGEGNLDAAVFTCPATQEINTTDGKTKAHGRCMITGTEGADSVFADFTCAGIIGGCKGRFLLTGGTGKFAGIKGSSDMVVRSALGGMAVDVKSGSVIQAAQGLAIWPNLKYTLP